MSIDRAGSYPVTVIIPVRDEEKSLPSFLTSLDRLVATPQEFIFVDTGSFDNSVRILAEWASLTSNFVKIYTRRGASYGGLSRPLPTLWSSLTVGVISAQRFCGLLLSSSGEKRS